MRAWIVAVVCVLSVLATACGGASGQLVATGTLNPACGHPSLEPFASSHVSAETAVEQARKAPGPRFDGVIAVLQGHRGDFEVYGSCGDDGHAVWGVVVDGTFPPSCAHQAPCPPTQHTAVVFIDFASGAWVGGQVPAPSEFSPPPDWSPSP